jgi:predicted DCC family thiol-disulfide oxidoreductase YuxK
VGETDKNIILFDGDCYLCSFSVRLALVCDRRAIFRFASLQSQAGKKLLARSEFSGLLPDSVVVISRNQWYLASSAVFKVLDELGYPLKVLTVFSLVPKGIRDWVYFAIADTIPKSV